MLHSTAVKASTPSINSHGTKYQDIFHIFRQNMQTDGGRNKTPIMHALKSNDRIIKVTCLSISPGFVTVVLKNPSHSMRP